MKTLIKHRVNQVAGLRELDKSWGAEIDLRTFGAGAGKFVLAHDPWQPGDDFETWLKEYARLGIKGPVILNTKEDGLEQTVLDLLKKYNINDFFFLDTALPTLVKWTMKNKNPHFAVRFSKHEPVDGVKKFAGLAKWVWADCFDGTPPDETALKELKKDFKICLVSPELQGLAPEKISEFGHLSKWLDAICTKRPDEWTKFIKD